MENFYLLGAGEGSSRMVVRFLKDVIDTFNSGLQEGLLNTQNASEPVDSSPGAGSEVFA